MSAYTEFHIRNKSEFPDVKLDEMRLRGSLSSEEKLIKTNHNIILFIVV